MPPWVQAAKESADPTSRAYHLVEQIAKYADSEEMPYIHLYDGGLTDNLGVRPFLNRLTLAGGSWNLAKAMGVADVHRMLVFVINAQSEMDVEFRQTEVDLSLGEAITAVSSIPLNEFTFDSLSLLRLSLDGLASNLKEGRCEEWAKTRESTAGCDDFKVYVVEVDFDKLADRKRRKEMKHLPTSFALPVEQVDDLRAAAREIVTGSRSFQEFLRDMNGRWSPPAKK
jgi:NTE family protein